MTEYYRTLQSIEHSETDYIHLMTQVDKDAISDPYLVYVVFNGRKDIRRFSSIGKAQNYYEILSDLYFFTIDEALEKDDPILF